MPVQISGCQCNGASAKQASYRQYQKNCLLKRVACLLLAIVVVVVHTRGVPNYESFDNRRMTSPAVVVFTSEILDSV